MGRQQDPRHADFPVVLAGTAADRADLFLRQGICHGADVHDSLHRAIGSLLLGKGLALNQRRHNGNAGKLRDAAWMDMGRKQPTTRIFFKRAALAPLSYRPRGQGTLPKPYQARCIRPALLFRLPSYAPV